MSKPDGGSAFPLAERIIFSASACQGMSLRDYFASAALQGIMANGGPANLHDLANGTRGGSVEVTAAYVLADAMIAQRDK